MSLPSHLGEHPRLGAMDVCPFVPVRNATMDDCVECANNFGKRAAEGLGIPGKFMFTGAKIIAINNNVALTIPLAK